MVPDWPLIADIALPVVTAVLGYWFARRETDRRIIAERRAEAASRFIEKAYFNLRYLFSRDSAKDVGSAVPELTIFGEQARFFLSEDVAQQVDRVATQFVKSLGERLDPDPDYRGDPWKEYKAEVDLARALLRAELDVAGPLIRLPLRWRLRQLRGVATTRALPRAKKDA